MIDLEQRVLDVLGRAIDASAPRELCGYLVLDADGRQHFRALENLAGLGADFFISRADDTRMRSALTRSHQRIVAFVHSHRGTPTLSAIDRAELARSELPWLIVTRSQNDVAYRWYAPAKA